MSYEAGASWAVEYADGSVYCRFEEDGSENTWADIRWPDVVQVAFKSADAEAVYDYQHPGTGWAVRLGSRCAINALDEMPMVRTLLLVTYREGHDITPESVGNVFYWFPDGSSHQCDDFNCPDVQKYIHTLVHGLERYALPQDHSHLNLHAGVTLVDE